MPKALKIWRPLAELATPTRSSTSQAYKFGRGVPQDMTAAIDYYRKAARKATHRPRTMPDCCSISRGRQSEAIPYLDRSAERGESRAPSGRHIPL